jgi:hypothetical protein
MAKQKTNKPSTRKKKGAKKWWSEYKDLFTLKMKPIDDAFIDRLALDLMAWAEEDNSLRMTQFYHKKGMSISTFQKLMKRNANLNDAFYFAKSIVADRRELMAFKSNPMAIYKTQSFYCPVFKQVEDERARLAKDANSGGTIDFEAVKYLFENTPKTKKVWGDKGGPDDKDASEKVSSA